MRHAPKLLVAFVLFLVTGAPGTVAARPAPAGRCYVDGAGRRYLARPEKGRPEKGRPENGRLVRLRREDAPRGLRCRPLPAALRGAAKRARFSAAPVPLLSAVPAGVTAATVVVSFSEPVASLPESALKAVSGAVNEVSPSGPREGGGYVRFTAKVEPEYPDGGGSVDVGVTVAGGRATGVGSGLRNVASRVLSLTFSKGRGLVSASAGPADSPAPPQDAEPSAGATPVPTARPAPTPKPPAPVPPAPVPPVPTPALPGSPGSCPAGPVAGPSLLPVFPGAEGFGSRTVAGSGRHLASPCTTVRRVTHLGDAGPGSLRACVEGSGPRTCVFEVSGIIRATKAIRARHPYLTVAGHTAPSPGVALRGAGLSVEASEVLVSHLRFRIGDDPRAACCKSGTCSPEAAPYCAADPGSRDGITVVAAGPEPVRNVVFDHVSISWALDEGFSVVPAGADVTDVTFADSVISSGLELSVHPEALDPRDPGHSKAVLINGAKNLERMSFVRNLLAHNVDRNIRMATGGSLEYVNNVVYNWGRGGGAGHAFELSNGVRAVHRMDLVGNVYKPGVDSFCPSVTYRTDVCRSLPGLTDPPAKTRVMNALLRVGGGVSSGLQAASRYHLSDNFGPWRTDPAEDEWNAADRSFFKGGSLVFPANRAAGRVSDSGTVTVRPAGAAYDVVLAGSGARPRDRDAADVSAAADTRAGTGAVINCVAPDGSVRCEKNAGGWPTYEVVRRPLVLPADPNGDDDADGYTNLEEWLAGVRAGVE